MLYNRCMKTIDKSAIREIRKLYERGLSKSKVAEYTGLSLKKINETLKTVKPSTIEKHKQNSRIMAEQLRNEKLGLTGFKVQRGIKETAKKITILEKVEKVESSRMSDVLKLNRLRDIRIDYGRKSLEKVEKILKKQTRNRRNDKVKRKRTKEINNINTALKYPRYEYGYDAYKPSTPEPELPEEPEKKGYHIIITGVVMAKDRKYTLVDMNFYTEEPITIEEIFAYVKSQGYDLQRTNAMKNANEDRVSIGVIKGAEYIYHNTEITKDWKSSFDKTLGNYNFRSPKSGAYWRKVQKLHGKKVSNPEYQKMFDERGIL